MSTDGEAMIDQLLNLNRYLDETPSHYERSFRFAGATGDRLTVGQDRVLADSRRLVGELIRLRAENERITRSLEIMRATARNLDSLIDKAAT